MIEQLKRRVMGMLARAVLEAIDDSTKVQSVQISVLDEELHDAAERFENYGFKSVPFPGAEAVVGRIGGTNSHGIVLVIADRRHRPTGWEPGEVGIYDDQGQVIRIKRDGIDITTDKPVRVTAEKVEVTADEVTVTSDNINLGGTGGAKVARVGDSVAGGFITSGSDKVKAA